MKKLIVCLMVLAFFSSVAFASSVAVYERDRPAEIYGWSIHVEDDDVDASAELITELDTTFAQLAAEDTLEVLSASAADITQTVTVTGIDSSGNQVSEDIVLNTTNGTTAVAGTTTFRYVDQASIDIECVGIITIRRATGDTFITSIPIGELEAGIAQHFNGDYNSYVSGWKANSTGAVGLELRWYPDDADCLDSGDGYKVLDRFDMAATSDTLSPVNFPQPIKCDLGGWISIHGIGVIANTNASVTVQGYDTKN